MGLYQGRRIGPYVERTYLQLLEQRYLPSLFNGLVKEMNAAPPESEEKTRRAARDANAGG
ncbi:IcmF-like protein [Escherichia coli]|uniref:IcmF-like protein n=1 Tax=Escherichia coli TaxID=562 RepID=A0A376MRD2_ECOLX|nr:IcmF-like protein [Escherichia coli]